MLNAVSVSVCIPMYNGALYIRDALQSIFNQTVIPQEIIVSDTGSSDGSENIVREEAQRSKIKVSILPAKTPGMVANWNSTIRAASGKYIKFLFQDDLLHSNCLEEMVKVAESDKHVGLVFGPRDLLIEPSVEEDPMTRSWLLQHRHLSAAFDNLETTQPGSWLLRSPKLLQDPPNKIGEPTAVLVRTDLFGKVGLFDENMRQLVDMEMWVRLMASSHVGYVPSALSSVRVHARRATSRHTEETDRFERHRLQETLRTSPIYPLLHWRVKSALRFRQPWRNNFGVKKKL